MTPIIGGKTKINPALSLGTQTPANSSMIGGMSTYTQPKPVSPLAVNTNRTAPSTAITSPVTPMDAQRKRSEYETRLAGIQESATRLQGLVSAMAGQGAIKPNPLSNPDEFLSRAFDTSAMTETETRNQGLYDTIAEKTKSFFSGRQDQIDNAYKDFGVNDARSNLAETNKLLAERQVRLRTDLKALETSASERGVARQFAIDRQNQIKSEGAFDLANLAIIQSAQLGNLEQARTDAQTLIDQQFDSYKAEIAQYEAEIEALKPRLNKEQQMQLTQIEMALGERKRLLEEEKSNQALKYEAFIEASKNGAPKSVTDAILASQTPDQAWSTASPYIGLIDRNKALGTGDGSSGITSITTSTGEVSIDEIDFDNPEHIEALPVSGITKSVIQGFIKTKELTPTQKGQVAVELQQIGFNPNSYILKKLDSLVETWSAIPEESRGVVEGLKFWQRWTDPDVAQFESQKQLLTREIARLFDVGVLSDQDVEAYKNAMPSRQDQSLEVVLNKVSGIGGAATGNSVSNNVGKTVQLKDGRTAVIGADGNTLLDPKTGKPI